MTDDAPRSLRDDPVAQAVSALAANGFPRLPATVLMTLMTSEETELTAEVLAERTQSSPAAISGAVRYLTTIGMIRRHVLPGSRRYVYELPEHPWYTVSIEKNELYGVIEGLARKAVPTLGPRGAAEMEEMAEFFAFLRGRLPQVLGEWNELRKR
jgi:predicted transcriptional regulator